MSEDLTQKLPSSDSEKIGLILSTVQHLETRVDKLEQKVEERLYDTRPIWQKVVADIAQLHEGQAQLQEGQVRLQEGQAQLQEGQNRLEGEVREIKGSVREIFYKLDVLNETMLTVQAKHKDLDVRVRELEHRPRKPTNSET